MTVKKRAIAANSEHGIQALSATGKEKTTKTTESRKYLVHKESGCIHFATTVFLVDFYMYFIYGAMNEYLPPS